MAITDDFKAYFATADGTATWDSMKPHFDWVFHDDLVVVTADGEIDRARWAAAVQKMLAAGDKISDADVHTHTDGAIHYTGTLTEGDGTVIKIDSTARIKDGKIVRIEPLDPATYSKMIADANKI